MYNYRAISLLLGIYVFIGFSLPVFADDVNFSQRPVKLKLYARDLTDSASVPVSGMVIQPGYDSIRVMVQKDGEIYLNQRILLEYSGDEASFAFAPRIRAGMFEYSFSVDLINQESTVNVLQVDSVICGDVYILSGQSNAHYAWADAVYKNEFCRTFGVKTESSNYYPYLPGDTLWSLAQGSSELGPAVGTLGIYIQKMLLEGTGMPTCLINGGTGGSIIQEHLPDPTNRMDLNTVYGKVLYRVHKAGIQRIRAIIWHQGENDSYVDKTSVYADKFRELYDAWQEDFEPEKVYVFQIRPGCGGNAQSRFREVQRTLPEVLQEPEIELMSTTAVPGHDGCHYSHTGYKVMAAWIYRLLAAELYGSNDTIGIYPPDISKVVYDPAKREIAMIFDQTSTMVWPADTLGEQMRDYFYLDGSYGLVESGRASGDSVILRLTGPQLIEHLTYLPDILYNTVNLTYEGPWLKNSRGVGALTFNEFPVENPSSIIRVTTPNGGELWTPNSEQMIQWTHTNVNKIKIEFSADNGVSWSSVAADIDAGSGSYQWQTPDTISQMCRIRITAEEDTLIADESNGNFGIFAKSLTIVAPNGGESWPVGSTQNVLWNSQFIDQVRIQYTVDDGANWKTVKRIISAVGGQAEWIIPNDVSDLCRVRIIDTEDANVFAESDTVFSIIPASGIVRTSGNLAERFELSQNYPNPFNPVTTINFELPVRNHVQVTIFDLNGRVVATPVDHDMAPGRYSLVFDANTYNLSSGTFFYRFQAGNYSAVRKMQLMR